MLRELAILLGTFLGVTAVAAVVGAENLGTAMTFGQLGFCVALVAVIAGRRPRRRG